jgi:pyruvate,water dikinase
MALRASVKKGPRKTNGVAELDKAIRDRVPPEHRDAYDAILADAKRTYRLRDERHLYGALPSCGIARRGIREVGRRAVESGALSDVALIDYADTDQLCGVLRHGELDEDALRQRRETARKLDATRIPLRLGPEVAPPPVEWMPNEGSRRALGALNVFMQAANADESAPIADQLEGLPVSPGVCEGRARLCETPADLERIAEGDILVAPTTTNAINIVLPILGAIVTDRGGALCHAAIVTREYGIPGVVGTRKATTSIADGDIIRVDGNTGVVTVLEKR